MKNEGVSLDSGIEVVVDRTCADGTGLVVTLLKQDDRIVGN